MARGRKGSITLFLALILTLIFSLCFSLLEAARVYALDRIAARSILLEMESAFGEYQPDLWEEYGLLFLNGGNDSGQFDLAMLEGHRMEESAFKKRASGFYQMALRSFEITGYSLAADDAGAAFRAQACAAIQAQLASGVSEIVKDRLQNGEELAGKSEDLEEQWESAKDAMVKADDMEKGKEAVDPDTAGSTKDPSVDSGKTPVQSPSVGPDGASAKNLPENPVDSVDMLKNSPILHLVVENPSELSGKAITLADTLARRTRAQGNLSLPNSGILDKVWFLQYLDYYFSCASGTGKGGSKEHALDYELEYCVAGKESDQENLETVVKQLLLIREAGNFMTIMQDGKKQALAMEIATAAVGFTGVAPLIQAVQIGILLAWSYVESILDVRCLLSGGRVAMVKAVTDWKSDVSLGKEVVMEKTEKTQSQKDGLNYREYLQILLLTVADGTLAYRAMDVIEHNVSLKKPSFRMDCQIHGMRAEGLYVAEPLFLGFITVGRVTDGTYHFRKSFEMTY